MGKKNRQVRVQIRKKRKKKVFKSKNLIPLKKLKKLNILIRLKILNKLNNLKK